MNPLPLLPILRQSWSLWTTHAQSLAVLSLPLVVMEIGFEIMPTPDKMPISTVFLLVASTVPFLSYLYEFSHASIYLWIRGGACGGTKNEVRAAVLEALRMSARWYPPTLCAMFLILVGSMLILPALYFLTVFAFVTPAAIESRNLGWMDILALSRQLTRKHFWKILLLISFLLVLELGISTGLSEAATRGLTQAVNYFGWDSPPFWISALARLGVILGSVLFRSFEAVLFSLLALHLWREREQAHLGNSGKSC